MKQFHMALRNLRMLCEIQKTSATRKIWSAYWSPLYTYYISFRILGSQESNASNGVQIGAKMKKIQPFEGNCTKLKMNFTSPFFDAKIFAPAIPNAKFFAPAIPNAKIFVPAIPNAKISHQQFQMRKFSHQQFQMRIFSHQQFQMRKFCTNNSKCEIFAPAKSICEIFVTPYLTCEIFMQSSDICSSTQLDFFSRYFV